MWVDQRIADNEPHPMSLTGEGDWDGISRAFAVDSTVSGTCHPGDTADRNVVKIQNQHRYPLFPREVAPLMAV